MHRICAAPGSPADQPSEPQAPPSANAGAAGEPVLSHAAASTAGTHERLPLLNSLCCWLALQFLIRFSSISDEAAGSNRWTAAEQPSKWSFGWAPSPPRRPGQCLSCQPLNQPAPLCHPAYSQWILFFESFSRAAGTLGQKSHLGTGRWWREQRERALPAAELSTSQLHSHQSPQHQQHYQ